MMSTIILYSGSGAGDFEIVGPAWSYDDARRVLLNARRLLTARGESDAVALLDSAAFAAHPATNHFNDDFHVLHAEVSMSEYESFRRAREDKRPAASKLAAAIAESTGPYIRFVAVSLQIATPEAWDVFISHASEDKEGIARPLYSHLMLHGFSCWLDEAEIAWGESIVGKIQEGLSHARYVIVVLSVALLQKKWAQKELHSALALELARDRSVVLPLIVGDPQRVLSLLPLLQDKRYLVWTGDPSGIERELRVLGRKHSRDPA
jgi:TIR domain